ncbi:hypothetical protein PIB30_078315, partial [Stylosanthes scabra]|nr:hypothetical protein [Stylosanthes scabra]
KYMVDKDLYYVEYEGIHQICFNYGRIDHEQKKCPLRKEQLNTEKEKEAKKGSYPDATTEGIHNNKEGENIKEAAEDNRRKGKEIAKEPEGNYGD